MRFRKKVALITGGGSSVGRAIALRFSQEGARVVLADKDEERCHEAARTVNEAGGDAMATKVDVSDEEQIQSMIGDTIVSYGSLSVLVNAATFRSDGDPLTTSRDTWLESMQVNLEAPWLCARYAAPFLKSSGCGSIVHLAPSDVHQSMPRRFPFAVTKSGILAMSRAMAIDFGPQGIRSNVIVTGYIQSDRTERELRESSDSEGEFRRILSVHPLGRVGTPKDVASAAAFLASEEASFITGAVLNVDGGRSSVIQDLHDWES